MTTRYRLLPTLDVASLGESFFLFDRAAKTAPVVCVPTQKIPRRAHDVVRRLKQLNPTGAPWTLDEMAEAFSDPRDRSALEVMGRSGYLEPYRAPDMSDDLAQTPAPPSPSGETPSLAESYRELRQTFDLMEAKHFFNRPSLFNVPSQIADADVDVGFAGLPFASMADSVGTVEAPDGLRVLSRTQDFWFDVYRRGAVSDVGLDGGLPSILGKGVMLKDYGDIGSGSRTVGDLFEGTRAFVDDVVIPNGIRPLFSGGDHAVTFPIVNALLRHYPDLCLIQLKSPPGG